MRLLGDELPLTFVDGWKESIAFDVSMHARQVQSLCHGQKEFIDLAAAYHHYFTGIAGCTYRFIHGTHDIAAVGQKAVPARNNDILPSRQRTADRFPGFAAHDDGLAHRDRLETFKVIGQAPRKITLNTDDAVLRRGNNDAYHELYSDGDRSFDVRMRFVIEDLKVVERVIEDAWGATFD